MMLMRHIPMRHEVQLIISMRINIDRIVDALRNMSEHRAAESIDLFMFPRCVSTEMWKGFGRAKIRKQ